MDAPEPPIAAEYAPTRDLRAVWLSAAAVVVGLTMLGAALMPYLALRHPLVLLALNPWPRHQILVAPHTDLLPFLLVITARTVLSSVIAYELAARYGSSAIERFTQRSERTGTVLRALERAFRRAAVPVLVLGPGPLTAAFAALSGMRRRVVVPSLIVGQAGWGYVNHRLGAVLAPWTKLILGFIERHLLVATLVCVAAVGVYQWWSRRRRTRRLDA